MSQPIKHDDSIEWILRAYENLKVKNINIKIVPVSINYDRIFDEALLANEMVTGEFYDISFYELIKKICNDPKNKLGKVFVKYSDPIDLREYREVHKKKSFNEMAMQLTQSLYEFQCREQPITKNSIICSVLLLHQKPVISMKKLQIYSKDIYNLLRPKNAKTYIANEISDKDITDMVKFLDLKVTDSKEK